MSAFDTLNKDLKQINYLVVEEVEASNSVDFRYNYLACTRNINAARKLASEYREEGKSILIYPFYNKLVY